MGTAVRGVGRYDTKHDTLAAAQKGASDPDRPPPIQQASPTADAGDSRLPYNGTRYPASLPSHTLAQYKCTTTLRLYNQQVRYK